VQLIIQEFKRRKHKHSDKNHRQAKIKDSYLFLIITVFFYLKHEDGKLKPFVYMLKRNYKQVTTLIF